MSPRSRLASTAPRLIGVTLLLVASSCTTGGPILTGPSTTLSGTPTPTPSPTATPTPTPTPVPSPVATPSPGTGGDTVTVAEGTVSLPGGYIAILDLYQFSVPGSLSFTADWVSTFDDIDIAVANGECTADQLSLGACTFAGLEESATMKPELLTIAIGAAAYTPLIGNFTAPAETVSYRITFTPNASLSALARRELLAAVTERLRSGPTIAPARGRFSAGR